MTDAPDSGLTDLIAAALGDKIMHTNGSGDRNRAYAAHVALVVEQHTNGRIAELEAELEKQSVVGAPSGRRSTGPSSGSSKHPTPKT